jgi:murein DD-endopeptidase MepM/ murein hydrolase activator NlpD
MHMPPTLELLIRRRRTCIAAGILCGVMLLLLAACDQGSSITPSSATTTQPISPTAPLPTMSTSAGSTVNPVVPTTLAGVTLPGKPGGPATAAPAEPPATAVASNLPPTQVVAGSEQSLPTPTLSLALLTGSPVVEEIATATLIPAATLPKPSQTPSSAPAVGATKSTAGANPTYVFPVQPASSTNYGPYHHDYPAVDIFCPIGSLFVAPTGGVVDYVSTKDIWDPAVDDPATRGGLSVAIIGDDGVRYYGSHLSFVQPGIVPGVHVDAGQTLGKTGHTGDARYVDPHLHFGISHPTTPDDWKTRRGEFSPYKYLRAWQVGTQLRPVLK